MSSLFPCEIVFERGGSSPVPKTSVVVPLHNYETYVEETLGSVLGQSVEELDLVIVEDGSTDRSLDVALHWLELHGGRFARATLLRNRANYGLPQTRNNGFGQARTEFVFALDADNLLFAPAIEKLERTMVGTGADLVYSQIVLFGDEERVGSAFAFRKELFLTDNHVDALALIRKSAWARAGGYVQLEATGWEDYDLWCTFLELGMIGVFVPQILAKYRVHKKSMLRTDTRAEHQVLLDHIRFRHPWLKVT